MHCNHWFRSNVLYWFRAKESESVLLFWFSKGYWEIVTARLAEISLEFKAEIQSLQVLCTNRIDCNRKNTSSHGSNMGFDKIKVKFLPNKVELLTLKYTCRTDQKRENTTLMWEFNFITQKFCRCYLTLFSFFLFLFFLNTPSFFVYFWLVRINKVFMEEEEKTCSEQ